MATMSWRTPLRWLLRIVVTLALVVGGFALYTCAEAGEFRELEALPLASCEEVPGLLGAEDLVIERSAEVAIVSSDARTWEQPGALYALTLGRGEADDGAERVRRLTPIDDVDLHPHGISLVPPHDTVAMRYLYVVDHPSPAASQVRVYSWQGQEARLELLRTVNDPLFAGLNDIAGLDDVRFYATNDHDQPPGPTQRLADLLQLSRGNVVYFDGERARVVASDIPYANGVALANDGSELYVASTSKGRLHRFARDEASGDLEEIEVFELGTGVDNIEVDRYGALWVAAHPKLLTFLRHAANHDVLSPSEALWIDPTGVNDPAVRPVWLDLGGLLSGSSVVVPFGSQLVIGSVFEPHVLVCNR
jgi:arylesterase/paraoxonase